MHPPAWPTVTLYRHTGLDDKLADGHATTTDKPSITTSQKMLVTATIEAINYETREVTLRTADGRVANIVASEEARNLKQAKVGDTVIAEYLQELSIEVFANDGTQPGAGELAVVGRSGEGEMPATVEEINIEANTFKLKGPSGMVKEYVARDPENLKKAEVGDLVVITYTEAVAISVEKTTGE